MPPRHRFPLPPGVAIDVCRCRECVRHRLTYGTRTFDADGYCPDGYDRNGRDRNGRDVDGFDRAGFNEDGYDAAGYDADGYDAAGYDSYGRDEHGYDVNGFNRDGYDRDGYDAAGYDASGYNEDGFDRLGYDEAGYDRDGFNRNGLDRAGYDEDGYNDDGYDRDGNYRYDDDETEDDEPDTDGLHNYSYRPHFRFYGDGPAYYGMELEVTSNNSYSTLRLVSDRAGKLAYLKEDGSVHGFELVTHPMSYPYFMENFPWELLPELRSQGCSINTGSNGIHVHVSRKAFSSPAHLFRWMKFIYRNQPDCERIARRSSTWGSFEQRARRGQKAHADIQRLKNAGKQGWQYISDDTQRNRYSAINTLNADTLEVRIFASTLRPERAKKALQLVAGSVEYTRQLRAHDVCASDGWGWRAFSQWLGQNRETYPELAASECPVIPVPEPSRTATVKSQVREAFSRVPFGDGGALGREASQHDISQPDFRWLLDQFSGDRPDPRREELGYGFSRDSRGRLRDSRGRFASADEYYRASITYRNTRRSS